MKSVRYSLIYQFFSAQIKFGYYRTGEFLPTIEELCHSYHASSRTVRNAYRQLQEDGYVSLSSGRRTTVIYEASPEAYRNNRLRHYLARKDAVPALSEALRLLLLPLMREGCGRLSRQALNQIREVTAKLKHGDFYVSFFGGRAMVLALKNHLALDLFNEVVTFYQFPHVLIRFAGSELEGETFHELSTRMAAACGRDDREAFFNAYTAIHTYINGVLYDHLTRAARSYTAPEQIPFDWVVYRGRPQHCYTLAARIIYSIYISCEYAPDSLLPRHADLAENYGVSYMTVRRTMALLETLGLVSVRHGVGAVAVRPQPDPARFQDKAVRQIHTMAQEAMQILRLAFDGIAARLFPGAPENVRDCTEKLRAQRERGLVLPAFLTCMDFLLSGSPNEALWNIWEKLLEALLLDLPLLAGTALHTVGLDTLIHSLEAGDARAFRAALEEQMLLVCAAADVLRSSEPE